MRFTADGRALLAAVGPASKVVPKRSTIPILSHMLLEAGADGLRVTADNLDVRLAAPVPAAVAAPGAIAVEAETLHSIVSRLPKGAQVTLVLGEDGRATLTAGRSRYVLPTLPAQDFPDGRVEDWASRFALAGPVLRRILEQSGRFVATEATRYYLAGTFLTVAERDGRPVLRACATDGHRLYRHEGELPAGAETLKPAILPRESAAEVARLCDEGEVQVAAGERLFAFTFPAGLVLTTKLIDGTFPDAERVIPVEAPHRAVVDRAALTEALDRVTAVSREKGRATKLGFEPGQLRLESRDPDRGEAAEEFEVECEAALAIGLNSAYLRETLGIFEADRVAFGLGDAGSPVVLTAEGEASPLCVIMPMRI